MWRSRTFWRLFGSFGVVWLASIAVLGWVVENRVERHQLEQIESSLRAKALLAAEMVRDRRADDAPQLQRRIESLRQETGTRITLMTSDGTVIADSDRDPRLYRLENHLDRPEVQVAQQAQFGVSRRRHSSTVDQDMMYVALRTDDPRGAVAFVRVALPLDAIQAQVAELRWIIWSAAAVAAIAGMLLAFWLGRRITRPLKELTAGAARIAAGDHAQRVFAIGQDEMGALARAFNTMSERLGEQFAQLEEDRAQLRAVLSGMVEGVIAIDAGERIVFANQCAGRLLGFADDTAVGRKLWEVVRQRSLQQLVERARTADGTHHEELKWETPAVKNLAVHAARLPGAPGQEIVLVFHDTTELRRLERVRQEFVANVSHELKTPLSVITACAETLLEGAADDPEHRASFLQQIAEQAERLHALILDLLSLARIEAGTEALELHSVPLGAAVAACLERHRARADAKNLVLEAVPPEELRNGEMEKWRNAEGPSPVPQILNSSTSQFPDSSVGAWADGEAVAEILDNLVDNAVKYTPPGGRIRVRWRADDSQAVVEVEDTGIGIPDRDLPRIFERFYRVDKARSRELGGTGLGLSIVKHLVQAMHGKVSAASRLGEGSIFTVRLPLAPSN